MADVTHILNAIEQGDPQAVEELLPLVYDELRHLAAQKMSQEPPGQTLQATALVHEAYIRLVEVKDQCWHNRNHFFMAAAEAMRRILVERARRKKCLKQGGTRQKIELSEANLITESSSDDLLALDEALHRLSTEEPSIADLVKLRYFGGLTIDQVAEIQGISRRAAIDHWIYARSWLAREIKMNGETKPE
ncbi:MAG: sigma-70 family RNA polymerase sigma factor [Sedimentisphaerales bacterium]|nr:sigma-70 family RNA polymerase sigma factor [Sedimentisphaerales bacterium]